MGTYNTNAALQDLPPNTTFYWQVRANNNAGTTYANNGVWWEFTTAYLIAPAESESVTSLRPEFDWLDIPGASQYGLQVSKNNTFTQLVLNVTVKTGSAYTPTRDLPKNLTLYWRVRAKTGATWSPYSEVRSFESANPPSTPILTSPANNALNKDYLPLFKWKAVTLAGTNFLHYQLQVDDNADFSSPVIDDNSITDRLTVQYQTGTPLAHNTKFYWRVRAVNDDNEVSNWSAVRYFRTLVDAPELVSPADGFTASSLRPFFDWDAPGGPAAIKNYTIQISKNTAFTQIVHTGTAAGSSYTPAADLPKNMTLYWRVRTNGANGPSLYSSYRSLNTPVNPPPTVSLLTPASNFLSTDYSPTLTWKAVVMPAGTNLQYYIIQVDDNADFSSPEVDATTAAADYTPSSDLASNTKYYWRVRAVNDDNEMGNWSAVRYFRTIIPAPTLLTPSDGGTVIGDQTPAFDWADAAGPGTITGYTIQISTSPTFSSLLVNATTASSTYTPTKLLPFSTTLYWRVRVNGANGPSPWSVFSFSITP